jgi:hypothetical protein
LGIWAALDGAWAAGAVLASVSLVLALRAFQESAAAMSAIARALETQR